MACHGMCSPQVESKDQSQFFNRSKCKATCGMALLSLSYSCALSLRHLVYTQPAPHPIWPLSTRPTPCLVHPQLALSFCTPYLTHTQVAHTQHAPQQHAPHTTWPTSHLPHAHLAQYPTCPTSNLARTQSGPQPPWPTPKQAHTQPAPHLIYTQSGQFQLPIMTAADSWVPWHLVAALLSAMSKYHVIPFRLCSVHPLTNPMPHLCVCVCHHHHHHHHHHQSFNR